MIKIHHKTPVPTHGLVREFSEELHGKDYKEVAKSYVERYAHNVDHVEGLDEKGKTVADLEKENIPGGIYDATLSNSPTNDNPALTKLPSREELKEKAKSYGLDFFPNIKTPALQDLVSKHEESLK